MVRVVFLAALLLGCGETKTVKSPQLVKLEARASEVRDLVLEYQRQVAVARTQHDRRIASETKSELVRELAGLNGKIQKAGGKPLTLDRDEDESEVASATPAVSAEKDDGRGPPRWVAFMLWAVGCLIIAALSWWVFPDSLEMWSGVLVIVGGAVLALFAWAMKSPYPPHIFWASLIVAVAMYCLKGGGWLTVLGLLLLGGATTLWFVLPT